MFGRVIFLMIVIGVTKEKSFKYLKFLYQRIVFFLLLHYERQAADPRNGEWKPTLMTVCNTRGATNALRKENIKERWVSYGM